MAVVHPVAWIVLFAAANGDSNFLQPAVDFFVQPVKNFIVGETFPEASLTPVEYIKNQGYPAENHYVTTEDGYILNLHRIPYGKSGPSDSRPPVFFQHGFVCSSVVWLANTPDKNLPYLLADKGYDVWLGNYRGNSYSRNHTMLKDTDSEFWEFSWEEMALIDLPTMLDYVLKINGAEKTSYIGHSMGASSCFALLATKTEYNDKIKAIMALAPAAILAHWKTPLRILGPDLGMTLLKMVQHGELPVLLEFFRSTFCKLRVTNHICSSILFGIFGTDWNQYNSSRAALYFAFVPSTTSVKVLEHFEQQVVSGKFCRFDYKHLNKKIYNQDTPPEFDCSKVQPPTAVFWGDNDWVAPPEDVKTLVPKLKNLVLDHKVNYTGFSHGDFFIAKDVLELVYQPVMKELETYGP